ncbi:MAG: SUMF1/EgtB/PvdO family nonheme iron enzyme [Myxococcota bacterium]|nr:SUMF1/EgtB/PvdO family nonheme iron enzyme [Myxococcota bacterium]
MTRIALLLILGLGVKFDGKKTTSPAPKPMPCGVAPAQMTCIPGGPFVRGSDIGPKDARPAASVWVQTFYMDQYEVTYAAYRACVKDKKCRDAGPNYSDFDHPRQPITGVSWHDAVTYCKVQGKHLPTEAEWEKAARGTDARIYSWGNEPATCDRAVIKNNKGRSCGVPKKGKRPEKGRPWEVGSFPPGIHDLYDMVGNSWEWVFDWYTKGYAKCGANCTGVDPKGPCQGQTPCPGHRRRVVRGGSWYWEAAMATTYYRRAHVPDNDPFHHFGFRCAASVQEAQKLAAQIGP